MGRITIVLFLLLAAIGCGPFNPFRGYVERNKYNGKSWYAGDVFPDGDARALALAGARGNVEKIRELHENGVDVNYRGKDGITPLLWALYAENKAGFGELLKLGANPNLNNAKDSKAMEVITYAAEERDDPDYLEMILKHGGDPNYMIPIVDQPLIRYVCNPGSIKRLKLVIAAGADLNKRDNIKMTPVMACALHLQYDKALFLLEKGAKYDQSIVDQFGHSLKDLTEEYPPSLKNQEQSDAYKKVIEFLAKKGIEVKEKSQKQGKPASLPVK